MDVLEIDRRGPAAWLWLNRPGVRNALNAELQDLLLKAFKELENEKGVRVLVLAGRGQAFCAGGEAREGIRAFLEQRRPRWSPQ